MLFLEMKLMFYRFSKNSELYIGFVLHKKNCLIMFYIERRMSHKISQQFGSNLFIKVKMAGLK